MRIVSLGAFNPLCKSPLVITRRDRVKNPIGLKYKPCISPSGIGKLILCCCNCYQLDGVQAEYISADGLPDDVNAALASNFNSLQGAMRNFTLLNQGNATLSFPQTDGPIFGGSGGNTAPCQTMTLPDNPSVTDDVFYSCTWKQDLLNPDGIQVGFTIYSKTDFTNGTIAPYLCQIQIYVIGGFPSDGIRGEDGHLYSNGDGFLTFAFAYECAVADFECGGGTFDLVGTVDTTISGFGGAQFASSFTIFRDGSLFLGLNKDQVHFNLPSTLTLTGIPCD